MALPPKISALGLPPSRSDPENFSMRADTFLGALPVFQSQANALADFVNADATAAGGARTATETARDLSLQYRNASQTARGDAQAARDLALQYRNAAQAAQVAAQGAATTSDNARAAAVNALNASQSARDAARGYRDEARDYRDNLFAGMTVAATTRDPGTGGTASWNGTTRRLTLGIPRGLDGITDAVRYVASQGLDRKSVV